MTTYPKRASPLDGSEIDIFKLVACNATPEQWMEWLRVPLEHAAARGNLDLFNKLLGAGADGSAGWRGCEGRTLLDAAAVGGGEEVMSNLLLMGAQPDVKVVSCSSKRSALYTATTLCHEAVARRLVVAGADVNFQDPVHKRSVLYEATSRGQAQLVTDLLITGADLNWRYDNDGTSPLHVAAIRGFDRIVSTLLLRGASKAALDSIGRTPLIRACWASHGGRRVSVVKTLLAAGADATVRGTDQHSALDIAAMEGYGDVIEAIAGHGADVNARDARGFTALHVAAQHDQVGAVLALVAAGGNIDLKESVDEWTPLAFAVYNNSRCKSALALLQHGAKVNVRDINGDTPLHEACYGRNTGLDAAVDLLLRWGADETALNDNGESPAELLDVENEENINPATQEEIDRTRLLLSRAPADRAWRRRGWLVVLRSRAKKATIASSCGSGSGGAAGAGLDGVNGCKEARSDGEGRQNNDVEARGGAGGDKCLSDVVALLTGLEMEGVFRTVVGFL